ncbi:MAG: B12-binding domain-containing radical SAM protein [Candidatus Bathyarchaeota archaeon]|nr:B12-binding domain-containing radical SAM protein [Candidatus Bathyarchaeota archaeon]
MKPHVTLVNPAAPTGAAMHMPFALLGIGYLAAVLEKNNYQVDVIDCQVLNLSMDEFRSEIAKRKPNIVGVTSSTLTYKTGLKLVKIAREVCPNCVTIAGGAHVTFWDDHALEECPELDIVVRREAEDTLLELVQRIEAGKDTSDVVGTTCRKGGKIQRNPDRPYIEDLDSLPFPARHLWPMEKFSQYEDVLYLAMSRGCVYWCEFCCTVRMHGRKFRMRSAKNVADELEFLYKTYGKTKFTFCDDAFTVDQQLVEDLCGEIHRRGLKIEWNCGSRVDLVTKELLKKMKDAGCVSFWFGAESGTQQVLDAMKKGITPELTEKVIGWVREVGLKPTPNVILGFPGETKESAWKTIKFIEKIAPDAVGFYNVATPFPGTPLYDQVKENGWLRVTDFDKYDTTRPIFETPQLSMKELGKLREGAFHHYYLRRAYFMAKERRFKLSTAMVVGMHLVANIKLKLRRQ